MFPLNILTSILQNWSFKISKIIKESIKIKERNYDYCKSNYAAWFHFIRPKHSFAHEILRENLSFHVFFNSDVVP